MVGKRVRVLRVHEARLRWKVTGDLPQRLQGRRFECVTRRAKYLLFHFDDGGTLILHLGMSGNLRVMPPESPRLKHDHLEWLLEDGTVLRFNDPRRFGSVHWLQGDAATHPLLQHLGPEPLEDEFDADYLWARLRDRRIAIKPLIMNAQVVVGVGNIYASEALFVAGIRPGRVKKRRASCRPSRPCSARPCGSGARRCAITSAPMAVPATFASNCKSTSVVASPAASAAHRSASACKRSARPTGVPRVSAKRTDATDAAYARAALRSARPCDGCTHRGGGTLSPACAAL